jgi:hypothetical protein
VSKRLKRLPIAFMLGACLTLSGCASLAMGVVTPMIASQKRINLMNTSFAAVDVLAQQTQNRLERSTPLRVDDLQEVIDFSKERVVANPKVGRVLAQQMRTRFVQLGYNVVDTPAYQTVPSSVPAEVTGTYEIRNSVMAVSLRVREPRTGRILGVHDYSLPVTYDIRQYMTEGQGLLPPLFESSDR